MKNRIMTGLAMAAAMLTGGSAMLPNANSPARQGQNQQVQPSPRSGQQQQPDAGAGQTANPNQQRDNRGGGGPGSGYLPVYTMSGFGNGRGHRDQKGAGSHRNLVKRSRSVRRKHSKKRA